MPISTILRARAPLALALVLLARPAAAQDARVYELHEMETLPRATNAAALTTALEANYPAVAPDSAFRGTVVVSMVVGDDGVPRDIAVAEPADPAFDAASVASVAVLRFIPGTVGGRKAAARVSLPITWEFRDEAPPAAAEPEPDGLALVDSAVAAMVRSALEVDMVEEPPRVLNADAFQRALRRHFPALLRDAGVSGEVWVRFVVGVDGLPHDIRVIRSSAREFEDATVRAVRALRFRPARVNGRPVPVRVEQPVWWSVSGTQRIELRRLDPGAGGGMIP